jgi:hypothetical protein
MQASENPMRNRRTVLVAFLVSFVALGAGAFAPRLRAAADTLPARLSDQEFWQLSNSLSEDNGYFRSDNLLSNEIWFQTVIPDLLSRTKPGGVYLGVGPEQNFTYIAALKPKMVFITDIRRGNLHTQLMYKALFELSADRAEFMSRLFAKKRPAGLTPEASAHDLQQAYWDQATGDEAAYRTNLQAIDDLLTKRHELPLPKEDLEGIEYVYHNFYWWGPAINYNSSTQNGGGRGGSMSDYATLMEATDNAGVFRSYLANEANFKVLKDLEERNLIVPLVGNFGGPKALRAVGKYVQDHGATVTAFYLSNVEQYLYQDNLWGAFCSNVAAMPLDSASTFIRTTQAGGGGRGGLMTYLGEMQNETKTCASGGYPRPSR